MSALKKIASTSITALAAAAMLATSGTTASADPWEGPSVRHYRDYGGPHHHHDGDDGVAAGLLGLGAGLILGGALANSAPPPPPADYYYDHPRPWTPEWRAYCTSKYSSFNPRTGYFLGYDGDYHFCR
ncbi:BA14K family protein [Breoghania sp.]|uniref:BA14K family protein n=1 Tax=Breoghania sp. TaxID=2065378 RepID=UPI002634AF86|nr:BA14K family protein [Breoghania sp.]MDJ0931134.1 BA14K family protein [Breoghania sp.]